MAESDYPDYTWRSSDGTLLELHDQTSYTVLREGIHGFAETTEERVTAAQASYYSERLNSRTSKARELGFTVMIIGSNHTDIETKRTTLIKAMSQPGRLYRRKDDGTVLYIDCYSARGSPSIPDGLPKGNLARSQRVNITLTAPDPHFYAVNAISLSGSGTITLTNPGTSGRTPCIMTLSSNTAVNQTTGETMSARSGQTISGALVDVTDNGVTAKIGSTNVLNRFTLSSDFFMLVPGTNVITGVSVITYRPRWNGI